MTEQQLGPEAEGGLLRKKHSFSRESEEVGGLDVVSTEGLETIPQSHPGLTAPEKRQRMGKAGMRCAALSNQRQIGDFFLVPCTLFLCQYALISHDKVGNVKPEKKSEGK